MVQIQGDQAATAVAAAKVMQPVATTPSREKRVRTRAIDRPAATAPTPRQPISRPKPEAPRPMRFCPITGSRAQRAEPVALKAIVRNNWAKMACECQAKRKPASMPPHRRSGGRRDGGCGSGGQRRIERSIQSVLRVAITKTQGPPKWANTKPASEG